MSSPLPPLPWETSGTAFWTPPDGVTGHAGEAIAPEVEFFPAPPAEIGKVLSAYSTRRKGENFNTRRARIRIAVIFFVVGVGLAITSEGIWGLLRELAFETHIPRPFWAALPGAALAALIWRATRHGHACYFVGTEGCAIFFCSAEPMKVSESKVLCFQRAAAITASVTRHFRRRDYTYTDFAFRWYPPHSNTNMFEITGSHGTNLEAPPPGNSYHFGRAAESAWYAFIVPAIEAELKLAGFVRFYLGDKRWVRLGRGLLEIEEDGGAVHCCEAGNIGSAKLQAGTLSLMRRAEACEFFGPLGATGYFFFDLNSMRNSRLFLQMFEPLLGVSIA